MSVRIWDRLISPHEEDKARIVLVLNHEPLLLKVSKESVDLNYISRSEGLVLY